MRPPTWNPPLELAPTERDISHSPLANLTYPGVEVRSIHNSLRYLCAK